MEEKFKSILLEMQEEILKTDGITRYCEESVYAAMRSKPIKIITGFRRSGKSFLVKQIANRLIRENVYKTENVFYLNFEHFKLREISSCVELDKVFRMFQREIASGTKKLLLIFDEIQKVDKWDEFLRTVYEMQGEDVEIILTGSNSELLSAEIGSNLAGRFIEFRLLPFSFKEFLSYFGIEVKTENDFLRNKEKISKLFNRYRMTGGLPETLTINDKDARYSYLQGIVSKVIIDDVVQRFNIKNPDIIEKILYFLNINSGNIVSFSRLENYINRTGSSMNSNTVISYVNSILKTFALFEVQKFDWKQGRIFETTRKYYSVDTGITNSFDHTVRNHSKLLENIVLLELFRRKNKVYFGSVKSGREIDFITKMKREPVFNKYQVTEILTDENIKRETAPFHTEDKNLVDGENFLLIFDGEDETIKEKGFTIKKRNLVKWLLDL